MKKTKETHELLGLTKSELKKQVKQIAKTHLEAMNDNIKQNKKQLKELTAQAELDETKKTQIVYEKFYKDCKFMNQRCAGLFKKDVESLSDHYYGLQWSLVEYIRIAEKYLIEHEGSLSEFRVTKIKNAFAEVYIQMMMLEPQHISDFWACVGSKENK